MVLALLVCAGAVTYGVGLQARRQAVFFASSVSPNHLYRIDKYWLGTADSRMLIRVFDARQRLLAEVVRRHYEQQPGASDFWTCSDHDCTEYRWNSGDDDGIALPPGRLARLRALLP